MRYKRLIAVPFFVFALIYSCFFVSLYTVRAESGINGNEAWIVAVINGTFQYDGKYYRAKDEYIAQATAYMNRDDVNLTAEQASEAVDFIYRHVYDGVYDGYLYEIDIETGEPVTTAEDTEDTTEDAGSTTEDSTGTGDKTEDGTTENGTGTGDKTEDGTTENGTNESGKTTEATTGQNGQNTENGTDKDGKATTENGTDKDGKVTTESAGGSGENTANNSSDTTTDNDSTELSSYGTTDPEIYGTELPVDEHGAIILNTVDDSDADYSKLSEEIDLKELVEYEDSGNKTDDRPDKDKADAKVHIDEDSGEIYVGTGDDVRKIDKYFPDWLVNVITWVSIIMFTITAATVAVGLAFKCIVFKERKRRKYRKGHSRRRKIRRVMRRVLTFTTGISMIIAMAAGVMAFVFLRSDTVMQNLNKGGYFRHEYTNYLARSADEISTNEAALELDGSVEILGYEEFLFKAKKEVTQSLAGGNASEKVLHVNVAENIYDIKSEFRSRLLIPVGLAAAAALCGIAAMYLSDGLRSRGLRFIAMAFVIAGLVLLMAGIALKIVQPHTKIYADPDYLYAFIKEVCISAERSAVLVGVFLTAIGFMSFGLYRSVKKKEES